MLEVDVETAPIRTISAGSVASWVTGLLTAVCPEVEMTTVEVVEEAPPVIAHPDVMAAVVVMIVAVAVIAAIAVVEMMVVQRS